MLLSLESYCCNSVSMYRYEIRAVYRRYGSCEIDIIDATTVLSVSWLLAATAMAALVFPHTAIPPIHSLAHTITDRHVSVFGNTLYTSPHRVHNAYNRRQIPIPFVFSCVIITQNVISLYTITVAIGR